MSDGSVFGSHAFWGFGFDADAVSRDPQEFRNSLSYFASIRADLRLNQNQGRVEVRNGVARRLHPAQGLGQKYSRIRSLPAFIGRRKKRADIGSCDGSEQGIGNGVEKNVTVGMAAQSHGMRQLDPADLQRNPRLEFVGIPTVADAQFGSRTFLRTHNQERPTSETNSRHPRQRTKTVYVKRIFRAYNFAMAPVLRIVPLCLLILVVARAQTTPSDTLSILTPDLPAASLWQPYRFTLRVAGGVEPYRWRMIDGSLPSGWRLRPEGELEGTAQDTRPFQFTVVVADGNTPPLEKKQQFTLYIETPLRAVWGHRAQVSGRRIDGSVKVSNGTGRDFDLTLIVLAVNDIGRATAIGYQHFVLKKNTQDQEIPFGDTLSPGDYAVNVDVVGEEPVSNRIFRARLVTPQQSVTEGP